MIKSKQDLDAFLSEDLSRIEHRLKPPVDLFKKIYNFVYCRFNIVISFQKNLRKVEYYDYKLRCCKNYLYLIPYLYYYYRYKQLAIKCGFTIFKNCIGPGLFLPHYGGIIINKRAKIGKNCTIHSFVNIGENYGGVPTIGDNCFIGPGVKIFGDITIGNNVSIGANAVVNRSFPDNCIIAGIPAKIVRIKENVHE